ncbi:MAG: hypothetical protein HRU09_16035 [Oligoflexales bacterium]|nr:hypothetical protein [Oligoflexales bacterium]
MGYPHSRSSKFFLAFAIAGVLFGAQARALAKIGTRVELGWVWYDQELGSGSKKNLEGKISSLGLFYPVPFAPSVHLGLGNSK